MKKLLALALAIVMMMAIALPVFAAAATETPYPTNRYGDGNDDSNEANYTSDADDSYQNDTELRYGVAQAYTVTIPAMFELHQCITASGNQTVGLVYAKEYVTVSDVVIAGDDFLNIYLASGNTADAATQWLLKDYEDDNVEGSTTTSESGDVKYFVKTVDIDNDEANDTDLFMATIDNATAAGIANGAAILTCAPAAANVSTTGSTDKAYIYFSSLGTAQEGTYLDTLTFKIEISETAAVVNP